MRKGELPIESTLDLHGLTLQQINPLIDEFINNMLDSIKRYGLIITGKGEGVLQRAVPQYLRQTYGEYIRYIEEAHIRDGGSGAFYIVLKKNK